MSHTPHELADEFPEHADRMHKLKTEDAHFAKLFDDYHEINRTIHRAETNVEPVEELTEVAMRKQRVALKDEIYRILAAAAAAA
ncbi:MAG: YdcH family protein [Rhodobacteraceae bacterium]|nr:YdcH family protein [Paracoccaceae bacterium]